MKLRGRAKALAKPVLTALLVAAACSSHAAAPAAVTLEEMVARVKKDTAAQRGASLDDIQVVSATATVWRDTSMGCGGPTESHARIDLEGFRIVVEYAGQRFDYRARSDGYFMVCGQPISRAR